MIILPEGVDMHNRKTLQIQILQSSRALNTYITDPVMNIFLNMLHESCFLKEMPTEILVFPNIPYSCFLYMTLPLQPSHLISQTSNEGKNKEMTVPLDIIQQ